MKKCPKCGTEFESKFCPNCGTPEEQCEAVVPVALNAKMLAGLNDRAFQAYSDEYLAYEKSLVPGSPALEGAAAQLRIIREEAARRTAESVKATAQAPAQAQPQQPNIIINNVNTNSNINANAGRMGKQCNKWVALCLCFFLGVLGAHKFYEGKAGMGILYLFTAGLLGIGVLIDFISILLKPNPYYV